MRSFGLLLSACVNGCARLIFLQSVTFCGVSTYTPLMPAKRLALHYENSLLFPGSIITCRNASVGRLGLGGGKAFIGWLNAIGCGGVR